MKYCTVVHLRRTYNCVYSLFAAVMIHTFEGRVFLSMICLLDSCTLLVPVQTNSLYTKDVDRF